MLQGSSVFTDIQIPFYFLSCITSEPFLKSSCLIFFCLLLFLLLHISCLGTLEVLRSLSYTPLVSTSWEKEKKKSFFLSPHILLSNPNSLSQSYSWKHLSISLASYPFQAKLSERCLNWLSTLSSPFALVHFIYDQQICS